jgi:UDP-N-acetylglucosamine acyltransferase
MTITVHPSSIIEKGASLAEGVTIGPFCHIGPDVVLGEGVTIHSHVVVTGATTIGGGCTLFPAAIIGGPPQNAKHTGGRTTLTVGENTLIREGVTMHTGTDTARGATEVGSNCAFLAYAHVSHDSVIGNNVTFANNVMIGGHCDISDFVIIGGGAAVHQFVRIGHHAMIGGLGGVFADIIPFGMAAGIRTGLSGLNIIGMRRAGLGHSDVHAVRKAYGMLFDAARPLQDNIPLVAAEFGENPAVVDILDFVRNTGSRPLGTPARSRRPGKSDEFA